MTQHTPGKWKLRYSKRHNAWEISAAGFLIATMYEPGPMLKDLRAANARLIAAAPDMLEALENTTASLAYLQGEDWETVKKARAAIASVRGPA